MQWKLYLEKEKKNDSRNGKRVRSNRWGVKSTETYKVGKQLLLWYDGIEDNKLFNTFENLLPSSF